MAGKVHVYMGALNLMPQICSSWTTKNHNNGLCNISFKCTKSCKCQGYSDVPSCMMCAAKKKKKKNCKILKFLHMCFTSLNNVAAGESSKEICNPWCMCGVLLSDHYYDCPGTIGRSGVMLITSDQDNTYGRANTMTRHIYTNNAPPPPNPCEERMKNSTQTN